MNRILVKNILFCVLFSVLALMNIFAACLESVTYICYLNIVIAILNLIALTLSIILSLKNAKDLDDREEKIWDAMDNHLDCLKKIDTAVCKIMDDIYQDDEPIHPIGMN